jgi:hypothetical protein
MMNTVFCHSKALDKHDQTAHSSALILEVDIPMGIWESGGGKEGVW